MTRPERGSATGDGLETIGLPVLTVELLSSLPLTVLFVNLVARYWAYCDIGINAAANSVFLSFLVAPVMVVSFAGATVAAGVASRDLSGVKSLSLWILYTALVFGGAFLVIFWMGAGSCRPNPGRGDSASPIDWSRLLDPGGVGARDKGKSRWDS